jgi:Tfp pilus assembly protein PilX
MVMQDRSKQGSIATGRHDEKGFVLIVTMLVLVVLTIFGLAALDNSTFELRIAANDRWSKVAFNLADGGVYSSSKLITTAIEGGEDPGKAGADPDYSSVLSYAFTSEKDGTAINNADGDFYRRVMGFSAVQTSPDFQIKPNGPNSTEALEVRIAERNSAMIAGGGVEFGAGAAGVGAGASGGGAAVTFDVEVNGYAGNNSRSTILARYRKVLGASGGL